VYTAPSAVRRHRLHRVVGEALWIGDKTANAVHDRGRNGWIEVEKLIRIPIREQQKLSLDHRVTKHERGVDIIRNRFFLSKRSLAERSAPLPAIPVEWTRDHPRDLLLAWQAVTCRSPGG
jgi:hypothetical protein